MNNLAEFQHLEIDKAVELLSRRLEVAMEVMEHFRSRSGLKGLC